MIVIVGCGGTGSNLAPMLSRMLLKHKILLIDGDRVEARNVERQTFQEFDIGMNKARALAKKLNSNFKNEHYFYDNYIEDYVGLKQEMMKVYHHNHSFERSIYDDESKLNNEHNEYIILIGCVDNNATRAILEETYINLIDKCYYIDAGNESDYGTVLVSDAKAKEHERNLRSKLFGLSNKDDHPTLNCHRRILQGDEQQYQINLEMALAIAKVVFAIKGGKEYPHAITVNGFDRYSTN